MQDKIVIKGARQHNLKDISLEIPRNALTVITGISGSVVGEKIARAVDKSLELDAPLLVISQSGGVQC